MLDRVISGGQSGADQAGLQTALQTALNAGIATGGTAPRLWLAEVEDVQPDGTVRWVHRPCPRLLAFGLVECDNPADDPTDRVGKGWQDWVAAAYQPRTIANAIGSDATLWFGDHTSPGGRLTLDTARSSWKPVLIAYNGVTKPSDVRRWIEAKEVRVLNVAGSRESKAPGIGDRVEVFLARVFRTG